MRNRSTQGTAVLLLVLCLSSCGRAMTQDDARTPAPTPTAAVPGTEAAESFLDLSRDPRAAVRWAPRVGYSLGGTPVGTLDLGTGLAASLRACPDVQTTYEGRACPVSPLTTLVTWVRGGGEVEIEPGGPEVVGCSTTRQPDAVAEYAAVSLRPPAASRNCFTDFAVTLYLDGDGRVAWVDFTLSGP